MVVLLDADVVIRWEKDIFNLGSRVASRPDDQFEIAAITVAELWGWRGACRRATKVETPAISGDYCERATHRPLH